MLTAISSRGYSSVVAAKSVTGRRNPNESRRNSAPTLAGAFFVPAKCYGGWLWAGFGLAGFLDSRYSYPAISRLQSRRKDVGDSMNQGVSPMQFPTRKPSKARALAHRAMAKAALFSNSSTAVRLRRYNDHMDRARAVEAQLQEVAQ